MCVWGGGEGGGHMTHAHVLLQLGYGGVAVSSSIGSREEHITLYFDINPQRVYGSACAYRHVQTHYIKLMCSSSHGC